MSSTSERNTLMGLMGLSGVGAKGGQWTPSLSTAIPGVNNASVAPQTGFNIPTDTMTAQQAAIQQMIASVMANMQQGSTGASSNPLFAGNYSSNSFINPALARAAGYGGGNSGLVQKYTKV